MKKLSQIEELKDPTMKEIDALDKQFAKLMKFLFIFIFAASIIIGIAAAVAMGEHLDHTKSYGNIDITFFGIQFDISKNSFFVSPFMIFIYSVLFGLLLIDFIMIFLNILMMIYKAKVATMNNTYAIKKMLEGKTEQDNTSPSDNTPVTPNTPDKTNKPRHRFKCSKCGNMIEELPCSHCGHGKVESQPASKPYANQHTTPLGTTHNSSEYTTSPVPMRVI